MITATLHLLSLSTQYLGFASLQATASYYLSEAPPSSYGLTLTRPCIPDSDLFPQTACEANLKTGESASSRMPPAHHRDAQSDHLLADRSFLPNNNGPAKPANNNLLIWLATHSGVCIREKRKVKRKGHAICPTGGVNWRITAHPREKRKNSLRRTFNGIPQPTGLSSSSQQSLTHGDMDRDV